MNDLPDGAALMDRYDAAITAFEAGEPMTIDPSLPDAMRGLFLSLETPFNLPFARELLMADPAAPLAQVEAPVMVVIGKKVVQVDWKTDGGALERAASANGNAGFAYPEEADHVLKHEGRPRDALVAAGAAAHYNGEGRTLDAAALTAVTVWLCDHARP